MPRLGTDDDNNQPKAIGGFQFSPVNLSSLGASEYTLVVVTTDNSGSVAGFAAEEIKAIKEIVLACQKSPRADNLLLRLTRFNYTLEEIHGFKPLQDCNPADYDKAVQPTGGTALFDAAVNAVESAAQQGKALMDADYTANAIVFVITDGDDNGSRTTPAEVQKAVQRAMQSENLESIVTILIGINVGSPTISRYLQDFSKQAGFTQYVEVAKADASGLAKLASFVSKSISSQSQALGTGGPSQALPTI